MSQRLAQQGSISLTVLLRARSLHLGDWGPFCGSQAAIEKDTLTPKPNIPKL